jgi:ParB family chromosome partitioning protein
LAAVGVSGEEALKGLAAIEVTRIKPSPNNPRENLTGIAELASSIREVGLIQPIVVQRVNGGLQIVAGHRRFAAVKRLGWKQVPCLVRRDMLPDEELLAMLVENGQRTDLDPIEEGRALQKLKSGGLTDIEIARKIGRSQPHVSGRLALLALPLEEQEELRHGMVGITAAIKKARSDAGKVRKSRKPSRNPSHLGAIHPLAGRAKARCQQLHAKNGRIKGVGGIACGECWESVIRADERSTAQHRLAETGACPTCNVETLVATA